MDGMLIVEGHVGYLHFYEWLDFLTQSSPVFWIRMRGC